MKKTMNSWSGEYTFIKIDLKMRVTLFLLIVSLFQLKANTSYSQKTKLSLQMYEVTVNDVIREIEELSDFKFLYNRKDLDLARIVSVNAAKKRVPTILKNVFKGTDVDFEVSNKQIVLKKTDATANSKTNTVQFSVSGRVLDTEGNPLPGASIVELGTLNGTNSDFDGNFNLEVSKEDAVLQVSYVGFIGQDVPVNGRSTFDIVLAEDAAQLDEVIVVGFGTQERKTVAGAVAQISGEVLEERPITNVANGLQGVVPGLNISRSGGQPGRESYSFNIRGASSLSSGGNSPLILVDGIEFSDINLLNPNDIKTFTLLKDASSSIYGARAAGGVILITTKSGGKNKGINVEATTSYSVTVLNNVLERVDAIEFIEMDQEADLNDGGSGRAYFDAFGVDSYDELRALSESGNWEPYPLGGGAYWFLEGVDWEKEVIKNGTITNHNVTISGGEERSSFASSVGYQKVSGGLKNAWDSSERVNLRFNHRYDLTKRLHLDSRIGYVYQRTLSPSTNGFGDASGVLGGLNEFFLIFPLRNQEGNYFSQWGFGNPRQALDRENGKFEEITNNYSANFKLGYDIIDGLKLQTQLGAERSQNRTTGYRKPWFGYNWDNQPQGQVTTITAAETYAEETYKNLSAYLEYKKAFNKHNFGVTVGASHEELDNNGFQGSTNGFTQDNILTLNQGDDEQDRVTAFGHDWAISSYFGRFTYNYDSKYIFEATYRRDGSSVFSPEQRWGNFAGGLAAWVLSEEDFIKNLNVFDNLKLRASYGVTGNQSFDRNNAGVGNLYDYIALVGIGGQYPFGTGAPAVSARELGLVTSARTWENVTSTNIGIDFTLLDNRLSGSFDYFIKQNDDMLLGVNESAVLGGDPPALNIGSLETKGFEFQINWSDTIGDDFQYTIGANLSDNNNTLIDLDGRDLIVEGWNNAVEGESIGTYYGLVYDGIIQNQVELNEYLKLEGVTGVQIGDTRYKDVNGDGRIGVIEDGTNPDLVKLGTNQDNLSFAFNVGINYKNFDFSTFAQGVGERTLFYGGRFAIPYEQPWWQPLRRFYQNTWTPDRPDARYPRLTKTGNRYYNYRPSELNKVNAAYLRIKNITFGYSLPKETVSKIGLDRLRFYFSGEDLFTFSGIDGGYDPENTDGGDRFYPFSSRYSFGINLKF